MSIFGSKMRVGVEKNDQLRPETTRNDAKLTTNDAKLTTNDQKMTTNDAVFNIYDF